MSVQHWLGRLSMLLLCTGVVWSDPLPQDSVYAVPAITVRNQDGTLMSWQSLAGQLRLVGMFYTSCQQACPYEITAIKELEQTLEQKHLPAIAVVLISLDPKDDQKALHMEAQMQHLKAPLFQLVQVVQGDTAMLGSVLGIHWRMLAHRQYVHNTLLTVLDAQGHPLLQEDATRIKDPVFLQQFVQLVR